MERFIAVICILAERSFRGDNKRFESPNNNNYLGLLELLAKFDPFLRAHINPSWKLRIRKSPLFVKNYFRKDDLAHDQKI